MCLSIKDSIFFNCFIKTVTGSESTKNINYRGDIWYEGLRKEV